MTYSNLYAQSHTRLHQGERTRRKMGMERMEKEHALEETLVELGI
jgi:hypothetical protein